MSICYKTHYRRDKSNKKEPSIVPCYYIAGICVTDPLVEGPQLRFLKSTFPYFHGRTYEHSKKEQTTMVPDNLVTAHYNYDPARLEKMLKTLPIDN